jgi:Na+/melibiose symporter-like transporter
MLSAFYGAGSTVGTPIGTLIASALINNVFLGFVIAGILMALGGFVAVAIMPREQSAEFIPKGDSGSFLDLLKSFRPPAFAENHDFYKAFVGRLCMLVSYQMIAVYQLYIVQDYVGLGKTSSAATIAVMSVIMMIVSLVGSLFSGPISDKIGRRKVPVVVASVLFAVGVAMPWIMPTAMGMYLFAGIAGFGYGVYSSIDQALNVDVLKSKEEAGKDLGILNLATTIGQFLGPMVTSGLVVAMGGYGAVFPTSIVLAILGCVFILSIKNVK